MSSAAPGATTSTDIPATFNHPTWAVKRLCPVTTLEEVRQRISTMACLVVKLRTTAYGSIDATGVLLLIA